MSDLHAADAQYHKVCMSLFRGSRNIDKSKDDTEQHDEAFTMLVKDMAEDRSRLWNSIELHNLYTDYKGDKLSRKQLLKNLSEHFGSDLLLMSGNGVATIVVFRSKASNVLKLVSTTDDDIDGSLADVARSIVQDSRKFKRDKFKYRTRLSFQDVVEDASPTLMRLFSMISEKCDLSLSAALMANIITSVVTNRPTSLQVALGVVIREKSLIELLYDFGVTSSYDEILRFKASAAHAASQSWELRGISNSDLGLVQTVADNFDANISSQNGIQSTHALVILLTQMQTHKSLGNCGTSNTITRLKKDEMKDEIIPDVPIQRYRGPQKPDMPANLARRSPLPLKILTQKFISVSRAHETDVSFMKSVVTDPGTPEFNGYNMKQSREQGHTICPYTKAVYLPLIDMSPAEPDTILTAMVESQRLTTMTGQVCTIFTNYQQLYRIAVNMTWVYPDRFQNFIPRLGGMHTLMSFAGSVGTLMADSGFENILQAAFGGVAKMLSGKNFPQNMRALRLVAEELLRDIISTMEPSQGYDDLMLVLDSRSEQSRTSKVWVDNLIKPVLIMMMFVRAEREADWPLHLEAVRQMIPYFFSAGHFNYAM